jgi:hypothetical protein
MWLFALMVDLTKQAPHRAAAAPSLCRNARQQQRRGDNSCVSAPNRRQCRQFAAWPGV